MFPWLFLTAGIPYFEQWCFLAVSFIVYLQYIYCKCVNMLYYVCALYTYLSQTLNSADALGQNGGSVGFQGPPI